MASMTAGLISLLTFMVARGNGIYNLWIKSFEEISFASFHGGDFNIFA